MRNIIIIIIIIIFINIFINIYCFADCNPDNYENFRNEGENFSWNKKWSKIGILFHHLAQNPMYMINTDVYTLGLRQNFWDDYAYGIQTRYKVNKIIFSGNLSLVESKNYLWKDGNNKLNFYAFINTIYLW
jgi:hypothetical protein